jgi:hypothetical protein
MDRGKDVGEKEIPAGKALHFYQTRPMMVKATYMTIQGRGAAKETKSLDIQLKKEGMRGRKSYQKKMTYMSKSRTEKGEQ